MKSSYLIGISRHRIGVDGEGVTTLVAFHGCPLRCQYCLNPKALSPNGVWKRYTPEELYNHVKQDELYFCATGGGVTFGGGEPLISCKKSELRYLMESINQRKQEGEPVVVDGLMSEAELRQAFDIEPNLG